ALLGLPPDADDTAAIEQAAQRQVQRVKARLDGPKAEAAAQLLSEIARARAVLLDPAKRAEYRASLAGLAKSGNQPWWQNKPQQAAASAPAPSASATAKSASPVAVRAKSGADPAFAELEAPSRRGASGGGTKIALLVVIGLVMVSLLGA